MLWIWISVVWIPLTEVSKHRNKYKYIYGNPVKASKVCSECTACAYREAHKWVCISKMRLHPTPITNCRKITFQRTGLRSKISLLMSSSQLCVLTTVLILNATRYFLHQSLTRAKEARWWCLGWWRPITRLVSSSKLSHDMAKMSNHSPIFSTHIHTVHSIHASSIPYSMNQSSLSRLPLLTIVTLGTHSSCLQ